MANRLVTDVDEFFSLVKRMEEVTIKEVSHIMQLEVDLIERWAELLSRAGLLSMHYPMLHGDKGRVTLKYKADKLDSSYSHYPTGGALLPKYY